jgi:predicted RNase H-like nuclease (RuvC/YqgF family)
MKTIDILERKNTEFSRQVEQARSRIDELESDRRNFTGGDGDEIGVDDMKSAQARKIVRLECTLAVLEAEVSHLSSTIAELEEQVCPLTSTTKIL